MVPHRQIDGRRNPLRTIRVFGLTFLWIAFSSCASVAQSGHLTAAEAKSNIGEKATVCGKVVSPHFAGRSRGQPTFLNLDEPYPKQIFTIVIWGSDREKFGDPEAKYGNKKLCITGTIKDYKGVPEVIANEPSQIEVQK
jgi:micrococcal nuclease